MEKTDGFDSDLMAGRAKKAAAEDFVDGSGASGREACAENRSLVKNLDHGSKIPALRTSDDFAEG